jgi:DNA-binding XRE family transcriptional regulator
VYLNGLYLSICYFLFVSYQLVDLIIFDCYCIGMTEVNPLRNIYYVLGKRIQRLRQKKGLTQEQFAAEIHISRNYLGYVESGKKKPTVTMLKKIADGLGVKVKDLFTF